MLEHLKRILSSLIEWHTPKVVWNRVANIIIDGTETSGTITAGVYDELTILHTANQAGQFRIDYYTDTGTDILIDLISYAANEVISRVYSITGRQVQLTVLNGGVATTLRETYCMLRKS